MQALPLIDDSSFTIQAHDSNNNIVVEDEVIQSYLKTYPKLKELFHNLREELVACRFSTFRICLLVDKRASEPPRFQKNKRIILVNALTINHVFISLSFTHKTGAQCDNKGPVDVKELGLQSTLFIQALGLKAARQEVLKAPSQKLIHEGINNFFLHVYRTFLHQLKQYFESISDEYPRLSARNGTPGSVELFYHLTKEPVEEVQKHLDFHMEFIRLLRIAVKDITNTFTVDSQSKHFVERLCCWLFVGVNLEKSRWNVLKMYFPYFNVNAPTNLAKLREVFSYLYTSPYLKVTPKLDCSDLHLLGCSISNIFQFQFGTKVTQFLRMPNIGYKTLREGRPAFNILPESRVFMEAMKDRNQTFLYVNLMEFANSLNSGHQALVENIVRVVKHFDFLNVKVISFDRYGSMATQSGDFLNRSNAAEFKYLLHERLSMDVVKSLPIDFEMIDRVHKHYFQGVAILERDQRCEFYEILLIEVLSAHLEKNSYDFAAIACEDTQALSHSFNALLYLHQTVKRKQPLDEEFYKNIYTMLFTGSILMRNSPPDVSQIYLFHHCAERIIQYSAM